MVFAGDIVLASDINKALATRVPVAHVSDIVSSAAIGTTETVVLTVPSTTYKANTAWELRLEGGYTTAAVSIGVYARVRKTNAAGAIILDFQRLPELPAQNTLAHEFNRRKVFTTGASAVTAVLVLTLQTGSSTVTHLANSQAPRQIDIVEIGDQADYPDAPDLT